MEDREIIKALEHCGNIVDSTCKECVYHETYNASCVVRLMRDALDLINRQKAEIEKKDTEIEILIRKKHALRDEISELTAEVERLKAESDMSDGYADALVQQAKTEAYRKFVMRALRKIGFMELPNAVVRGYINKIYEELIGE